MNCDEARIELLDATRGRLDEEGRAAIERHVAGCTSCASAQRGEAVLDEILAHGLPRYAAPPALKSRLALMAGPAPRAAPPARRWSRVAVLALAAGLAIVVVAVVSSRLRGAAEAPQTLTAELVRDHLRVLARDHPVDVESHGIHEVKPWFEGKLDFAPAVPLPDVPGLRLRGGAVGYVLDRKAALIVYALRLHALTLIVYPADSVEPAAPAGGATPVVRTTSLRGFHVASWRQGDLRYALVSDVDPAEQGDIAARFATATASPIASP